MSEFHYANARKLGGLQTAAQVALEYLKGEGFWCRDTVVIALERALANDGSEDYYSRPSRTCPVCDGMGVHNWNCPL